MAAEPVAAIPLEYENRGDTAARKRRGSKLGQWLLAIAWIACVIAWALIVLVDVELVIVTGPIIAVLGAAAAATGFYARRAGYVRIGLAHVGICVLFVVLVNVLSWTPRQAETPFALMGAVHLIATGLASAWLLLRHPPPTI